MFIGGIQAVTINALSNTAQILCPIEDIPKSGESIVRVHVRLRATGATHSVAIKVWSVAASGTATLLDTLDTLDCASSAVVQKCYEVPNEGNVFFLVPTLAVTIETAGLTDSVEVTANVYIEG